MGSKKTVNQTTKENSTQTVAPPSWTMPGILDASQRVIGAMNSLPGVKYEGDFVAQPDAGLTGKAMGAYTGAADRGAGYSDWIKSAAMGLSALPAISASTYTPSAAFDLNPVIQAATAPIMQQLREQTLPGLRNSAVSAGAYNNSRALDVLPGIAIGDALENAQNLGVKVGYEDFVRREQERQQMYQFDEMNRLNAAQYNNEFQRSIAGMLPDMLNSSMLMGTSAGDLYSAAGNLDLASRQAAIDNAKMENEYAWRYPFQGLDIATSLLSQLSGNYGTTTRTGESSSKTVEKTGGAGAIMQGVLGAASLAAGFPMGGGQTLAGSLFGGRGGGAAAAGGGIPLNLGFNPFDPRLRLGG